MFYLVLHTFTGFYLVLTGLDLTGGFTGFYLVLLGFIEFHMGFT